ncbi:MAG TPA: AI-2E family transporter [Candidatus Limnocylindrales bacterium]|nr:AI-2E family transporter [Candidatus Limnocylindrales bacterium]
MTAEPPRRSTVAAVVGGPVGALAAVVLVMVGMLALREVAALVVPVLFGLFLALVAWPLVVAIERRGVRHAVALAGAMLTLLVVVLAVAFVAALSVAELIVQIPRYADQLRVRLDALVELLGTFGVAVDPDAIMSLIDADRVVSVVRPLASAASGAGLAILVLVLTMIYALSGGASMAVRAREAYGERSGIISGIERFGVDLRRYLMVRALLGLFAAVLSLVFLLVLGIPFAILWAFLVFAASFIPNIGTFLAVVPPAVLAFLAGGPAEAAIVVVGYTLINVAQDQFLQPVVMGSELNLSPLVVFLSVLLWAWVLGPAGALLAVPMTVGLVAIMESHPTTRPIASLMRNRMDTPQAATPAADTVPPGDAAPGEP